MVYDSVQARAYFRTCLCVLPRGGRNMLILLKHLDVQMWHNRATRQLEITVDAQHVQKVRICWPFNMEFCVICVCIAFSLSLPA